MRVNFPGFRVNCEIVQEYRAGAGGGGLVHLVGGFGFGFIAYGKDIVKIYIRNPYPKINFSGSGDPIFGRSSGPPVPGSFGPNSWFLCPWFHRSPSHPGPSHPVPAYLDD